MAKVIIPISDFVKDGDLLIFKNGEFHPITEAQLFKRTNVQLQYQEEYIKAVEKQVTALANELKRDRGEIE